MGFLKKERAPDELPGLALSVNHNFNNNSTPQSIPVTVNHNTPHSVIPSYNEPKPVTDSSPAFPSLPKDEPIKVDAPKTVYVEHGHDHTNHLPPHQNVERHVEKHISKPVNHEHHDLKDEPKKEVRGEDYLEFSDKDHEKINTDEIKSKISEFAEGPDHNKLKYFDQVLDDINGGIKDLGKLEDWYENKFSSEDIISNMKGYWEGNKADIIIQSFGAEYKKKINENVKNLQKLEEDWRVVYFELIKKEEEMKKVEQELKGTLSEFVDLCKRRKNGDKKEK